jgi:TRAP-type C4-dicarboxylate transport system permease small subunit
LLERINTRLARPPSLRVLLFDGGVHRLHGRDALRFPEPAVLGDTLSVFCNIWVTMLGYSLAVRDREDIALRGFYKVIPLRAGFLLDMFWTAMVFGFGVYIAWFGSVAAMNVPGMFWELGGLKKMYPMLVMPIAGVLVAMAAAGLMLEDILILAGKRPSLTASGQEVI